jgi:hypothetical protein
MVSHESTKPKKGFEFVAKCETFFFQCSLNNIPVNSSFINAMKFKTNNAPRGHVNKLSKIIPLLIPTK